LPRRRWTGQSLFEEVGERDPRRGPLKPGTHLRAVVLGSASTCAFRWGAGSDSAGPAGSSPPRALRPMRRLRVRCGWRGSARRHRCLTRRAPVVCPQHLTHCTPSEVVGDIERNLQERAHEHVREAP
jgi:hypothetical protein